MDNLKVLDAFFSSSHPLTLWPFFLSPSCPTFFLSSSLFPFRSDRIELDVPHDQQLLTQLEKMQTLLRNGGDPWARNLILFPLDSYNFHTHWGRETLWNSGIGRLYWKDSLLLSASALQIALTAVFKLRGRYWTQGREFLSLCQRQICKVVPHALGTSVDFGSYDIAAVDLLLCLLTLMGWQPIDYQEQVEGTVPFKVSKWSYAYLCVAFPCGGHSGIHPGRAAQFLALKSHKNS